MMKFSRHNNKSLKLSHLALAVSTIFLASHSINTLAADIPPGYFITPNGKIMANNPKTAIAPPGYYLRKNGTLIKIDPELDLNKSASPAATTAKGEVPKGFHKMPNGELMANDPMSAVAPAGYHMMPNGILMANNTGHHGKGMLMFDLNYSYMYMKDMLDTTNKVTATQGITATNAGGYGYMMAPIDMSMHMTMAMVMYSVTDSFMVMGMGHYMKKNMTMLSGSAASNVESTMTSSGISDTEISGMLAGPYNLTFNIGLSLPTGDIDVNGPMVHGPGLPPQQNKYPYGMQLGTGTYDIKHGIDYSDVSGFIGWGASYEYTSRMNKNSNDYKWGNLLTLDTWVRYDITKSFNTTAKIAYRALGEMEGVDPELEQVKAMSPTMDAKSYGGRRLDLGFDVKYTLDKYSATAEFALPVYQNLWGPQMATSWIASLNIGAMY